MKNADVQQDLRKDCLKNCFEYGPVALDEPDNYDVQELSDVDASMAINGMIQYGAESHGVYIQWNMNLAHSTISHMEKD